ncbi:type II toxin-antitoxin system HicB family antitoxin [Pseudomonas putida]|uniref:Type II toxin-antitoxin system HicB family antitoxin n=1 Tax=Pseudomonas putida TaxID=303 RepID=A0A6I6XVB8_PSEPU|nr:type II toxin-antitoxin system HicB family antitoxin [Pseudomonas putida]QHG68142.1 type II toxin-antitoxin system HicB family antitoxin [Pseudomonas putida]
MKIPVVLHKDVHSDYEVTVPDVPGCFSAGPTIVQALENVLEAFALHFEGLVADDEMLLQVRGIEGHITNPDYAGGLWTVVNCTSFTRVWGSSGGDERSGRDQSLNQPRRIAR